MLWSSFYAPLPRDLIILSEGIANNLDMAGVTRVNPAVSLPLYPSYPAAEVEETRAELHLPQP